MFCGQGAEGIQGTEDVQGRPDTRRAEERERRVRHREVQQRRVRTYRHQEDLWNAPVPQDATCTLYVPELPRILTKHRGLEQAVQACIPHATSISWVDAPLVF